MRYVGMKQGDIWYVTFGPDKADETAESMARSTRTFKSEIDAKLFAMQILAKGWTRQRGHAQSPSAETGRGTGADRTTGPIRGWVGRATGYECGFIAELVTPGLVPGIHVLLLQC